MAHQYRSNNVNTLPEDRTPSFLSASQQFSQPPFPVQFPPHTTTPQFLGFPPLNCPPPPLNCPPPPLNCPPPPLNCPLPPPQHLVGPLPYHTSNVNLTVGIPPAVLPPTTNILPPTNLAPPVCNLPPTSVPPPCYLPSNSTAGPSPMAAYPVLPISHSHVTNTPPGMQCPTFLSPSNVVASAVVQSTSGVHLPQEKETDRADEMWLENWLSQRQLRKPDKQKNANAMTVCNARLLLKEALQALADLKASVGYLQNSTNAEDDMWQFKIRKALKFKEKLNQLLGQFSADTLQSLKLKLLKITSKRGRIRRRRLQDIENQRTEIQNREDLHAAIDSWRNEIQEKVENEKKKAELKNDADNILSEVRKKIQEAKKVLDQLEVLQKLRAARMDNSQKKGLKVSSASTEHFESTVEKLMKLMERQMSVYKAEEHALKVMLETEREQEKHDRQQQKLEHFKTCQQDTLQRLFSKPHDPSSPLFFYWQYYMQGHTDLESLVQIRHQWDMFLVPQDNTLGSTVPLGWVLPKPPSSKNWEAALREPESD